MTRGKHASRSIKRANEAAVSHIDRLTDQLAEAKIKARQYHAAAVRLPALEVELKRLRDIADGVQSPAQDEVHALRSALHQQREDNKADLAMLRKYVARLLSGLESMGDLFTGEQWDELAGLLHTGVRDLVQDARKVPRSFRQGALRSQDLLSTEIMEKAIHADLIGSLRHALDEWSKGPTLELHYDLINAAGELASRYHRWYTDDLDHTIDAEMS